MTTKLLDYDVAKHLHAAEAKPEVVAAETEKAAEILRKVDPEIPENESDELVEVVKARLADPQPGIKVKLQ